MLCRKRGLHNSLNIWQLTPPASADAPSPTPSADSCSHVLSRCQALLVVLMPASKAGTSDERLRDLCVAQQACPSVGFASFDLSSGAHSLSRGMDGVPQGDSLYSYRFTVRSGKDKAPAGGPGREDDLQLRDVVGIRDVNEILHSLAPLQTRAPCTL